MYRVPSPSASVSAADNDVVVPNNASLGIEDVQDVWDDSTGQLPSFNKHADESDEEEEFIFPGARTAPSRETPPSPSPQPSKSTLNPTAVPFTFRPAETANPSETLEEPPEFPEPTSETAHAQPVVNDSDDEEFHFPGAEKLADPIPAPVSSPSPQEPLQALSPVPENPLSVGPSSLAATSPAITMPSSPDLGPLSHVPVSVPTPAPVAISTPSPSPLPPPRLKRKPTQAQLEALYAAASSNDLPLLQRLFRNACQNEDVEEFALANDAAVRTGLTALHAAASRGYLEIIQWRESIPLRLTVWISVPITRFFVFP